MVAFRRLLSFAVVTSFLLVTTTAPALAAAANPFDMNDRFSAEKGAAGHGKIQIKKGEAVLSLQARDLTANHDYLVHVTVDFDSAQTITFPVSTNDHGKFKVKDFDLGLAQGTYRLDVFVTHDHTTGMPGDGADGDFLWAFLDNSQALLACQPFVTLTVP